MKKRTFVISFLCMVFLCWGYIGDFKIKDLYYDDVQNFGGIKLHANNSYFQKSYPTKWIKDSLQKANITFVAIKIENQTGETITLGSSYEIKYNNTTSAILNNHQVIYELSIIRTKISFLKLFSSNHDKELMEQLTTYNLLNKEINPGQSIEGLIAIKNYSPQHNIVLQHKTESAVNQIPLKHIHYRNKTEFYKNYVGNKDLGIRYDAKYFEENCLTKWILDVLNKANITLIATEIINDTPKKIAYKKHYDISFEKKQTILSADDFLTRFMTTLNEMSSLANIPNNEIKKIKTFFQNENILLNEIQPASSKMGFFAVQNYKKENTLVLNNNSWEIVDDFLSYKPVFQKQSNEEITTFYYNEFYFFNSYKNEWIEKITEKSGVSLIVAKITNNSAKPLALEKNIQLVNQVKANNKTTLKTFSNDELVPKFAKIRKKYKTIKKLPESNYSELLKQLNTYNLYQKTIQPGQTVEGIIAVEKREKIKSLSLKQK